MKRKNKRKMKNEKVRLETTTIITYLSTQQKEKAILCGLLNLVILNMTTTFDVQKN